MTHSFEDCEMNDSDLEDDNLTGWEGYSNKKDFINVFEASLKNNKNTSNSSMKTKENSFNTSQEIKYKFYWKEGGKKVELLGNFHGNWKKRYEMVKNKDTGFFEYEMSLTRGIYEFKFIVDSEWKCSKYYGVKNDKRDIPNNCIDLRNYSNISASEDKKENNKTEKLNSLDSDIYDCNLPPIDELDEVPSLPDCYKNSFQLDEQSIQDDLGKHKHLKNGRRGSVHETNYKEILPPSRDKLLHMCSEIKRTKTYENKQGKKNKKIKDNDTCIKITTTQKVKNKFVTLVFYNDK